MVFAERLTKASKHFRKELRLLNYCLAFAEKVGRLELFISI